MPVNPNLPLKERFTKSYTVVGDCWIWKKPRLHGYGNITHEGKQLRAHRVSFWLVHGWWPKQVNHICDNRACVNPSHLYAGTQRDNMRDRKARGGKWKNGNKCMFTLDQIESFRASGKGSTELARIHGVSQPYMSRLLRGERGVQ